MIATVPLPIGPGGGPLDIRSGQLLAMAVIMSLAVLNYFGVRVGGGVQIVVTCVKVLAIAAIIFLGIFGGVGKRLQISVRLFLQRAASLAFLLPSSQRSGPMMAGTISTWSPQRFGIRREICQSR